MADESEDELKKELEGMPASERKTLKWLANKFKSTASGGMRKANQAMEASKAVTLMAKAIRYSQDAQKLYWDLQKDQQKSKPDFDRAYEVVDRGIKMLDQAILAFPAQALSIVPLKEKMLAQKKDIELQRAGTVVDPDILMPQKPNKSDLVVSSTGSPSSAGQAEVPIGESVV